MNCNTKYYLIIDFGASRVKACLYNSVDNLYSDFKDWESPAPIIKENGVFEICEKSHPKLFDQIINVYSSKTETIDGVFIASEMHGFIIIDDKSNPITNYVSWRDSRSLYSKNELSTFNKLQFHKKKFKEITGMNFKIGVPFSNIHHIISQINSDKTHKVISLPEWIINNHISYNKMHETTAAATGLYDIKKKNWSIDLVRLFDNNIFLSPVFKDVREPIGHIKRSSKNIPIYGGIGDLQAAYFSVKEKSNRKNIFLNLGTGSQVITSNHIKKTSENFELRPKIMADDFLTVVSHVPSGRALNVFSKFIDEIYFEPQENYFWRHFKKVKTNDILNSTLDVDLNIFSSSWKGNGSGNINNINETNFTRRNFINSILKSYIFQYIEIIKLMILEEDFPKINIIMGGGIAQKFPVIGNAIKEVLNLSDDSINYTSSENETLHGMGEIINQYFS